MTGHASGQVSGDDFPDALLRRRPCDFSNHTSVFPKFDRPSLRVESHSVLQPPTLNTRHRTGLRCITQEGLPIRTFDYHRSSKPLCNSLSRITHRYSIERGLSRMGYI